MKTCRALLASCLLGIAAASPGNAAIIPLGEISAETSFGISNAGLDGPFEDWYSFGIAPAQSFDMSAFVSTGFVTRYGIDDFAARLYSGDTLLGTGISTIRTLPEGFPSYDVEFPAFTLSAGEYSLLISGVGFGVFPGPTASYSGNISFSAATLTVPEPGTLVIFALGLLCIGVASKYRRSRSRRH